jgi:hypothetical protein
MFPSEALGQPCATCDEPDPRFADVFREVYVLQHYSPGPPTEVGYTGSHNIFMPDLELTDDRAYVFCSAECLCEFVAARIMPDLAPRGRTKTA